MRQNMLIPLALLALPSFGMGQDIGGLQVEDLAQVEVLPGWRDTNGEHIAAIQITLAPGWITYWRAPGDGGIPPQFAFRSEDAIDSITPEWPTPEVFYSNGMHSIGYNGSLVLPIRIATGQTGPLSVAGDLFIGICEEICIPVTLSFETLLPPVGAADGQIDAALAARALPGPDAQVGEVTCTVTPIADGISMTASITVPQTSNHEFVVVEAPNPAVWVSQAEISRDGPTLQATVDMVHPSGAPFALDRSGVRITVLGAERAIDIQGCKGG